MIITPVEGTTITISGYRYGSWVAADFFGFLVDINSGNYNPAKKQYPKDYQITYPAYTMIDVGITQNITNRLSCFLQIDNVTNTDSFERLNTIITQPRTITLGIKLTGIKLGN